MNLLFLTFLYILILLITIFISKKFDFVDCPNKRKVHLNKTLNTSGLALYIFLFFIVSNYEFAYELEEVILLGLLIVACGFLDDQIKLTPGIKLVLLIIPTSYLILKGYSLNDLGQYEILGNINLGKFSFLFTLLACGLLINSYNYIDGIDGLLLGVFSIGIFYFIFLLQNQNIINLLTILLIPVLINLAFNFLPKKNTFKIFMGDSGSLFLGYFMSFLMIILYKFEKIHPAYLIWACWLPVFDFLFVTFYRIKNKKNFYLPDNIHVHHVILNFLNKSHLKTSILIYLINIIIIISGYLVTKNFGKIHSIIYFAFLFFIFLFARNSIFNLKKNKKKLY